MAEKAFYYSDYRFDDGTVGYKLILLSCGSITLATSGGDCFFSAPCLVLFDEKEELALLDSQAAGMQAIVFDVSFINLNITYKMIDTLEYTLRQEEYGFVPLDVYYEKKTNMIPLRKEQFSRFYTLFREFGASLENHADFRRTCRARFQLNMILELTHQLYFDLYRNNGQSEYNDERILTFFEIVHTDYRKNLTLSSLAERLHTSRGYLSRVVKKLTGMTVTEYITDYRLRCATHSLATTDVPVKDIAHDCGFSSAAYFTKCFRDKTGVTPTVYRRETLAKRKAFFGNK